MTKVVVKDNHLNFGGINYFRGHAEELEIGDFGEKRAPLTQMNYLEPKGRIPVPKIAVVKSTVVEIDTTRTTASAFSTFVSAIIQGVPVKFSGATTFNKLKNEDLKLVKFSVDVSQMKQAANNSPKALDDLAGYGNDARIVHQVFVVMDDESATQFDNNATAELSVGKGILQATVAGESKISGETTVQIAKGTGFAYLLLKIDWNKNKTKIEDMDDDQWSLN